ncbi:MAG: hypothetical protein IJ484_09820 [Oscillospiraceae bacterium]|nr:hypothetical protein [Oscillospiraceae bacterium]
MKKKILVVCLAVALCAMVAVGGTLAYFFDTATATNTFTVGNVQIELVEKGEDTGKDGYTNGDDDAFVPDQTLFPGSATVNNVAKRAWVTNTGANDAWVWAEIWVPAKLDDAESSENSLHFNTYGQFEQAYYDKNWESSYSQTPVTDGILDKNYNPLIEDMVKVEDGLWILDGTVDTKQAVDRNGDTIEYKVYTYKMQSKLPAGKSSLPFLRQVYMDGAVTQCTEGHEKCLVLKDKTHYADTWELLVKAYAMQVDGFDTVDEAIKAYNEANSPASTAAAS